MLKRLELVGFKSFADKTQFDFNGGITAIVGPNGSGKSNIVDAVRWIMGEQSAKSLRGGEMADVIFNGSSSRRSLGLAEVTMTFDNTRQILATEASEVQITRRVYRSGEGEYLINGQVCRLKDIKELFLGSGAGSDAYCIIAQGRVDALLQASTQDRRTIFEEAAGISRFKAKKVETLRKLERVDQNLQRLKDIIAEVEKQLRNVKLQASKAQRYQEYSQRLQELRVNLGLQEFHQLTERLQSEQTVLDELRARLEARTTQTQTDEQDLRQLEESLALLDTSDQEAETRLTAARQRIATEESTLSHERALTESLTADLAQSRARLIELTARIAERAGAVTLAARELAEAQTQGSDQRRGVLELETTLQEVANRLLQLQEQVQADKIEHFEQMRQAGFLQNQVVFSKARLNELLREKERLHAKTEQAAENLASIDLELQQLTQADEALQARLVAGKQVLSEQRQERERLRQRLEEMNTLTGDLRAQRSGLASRIEVLEGLERSQEGLGTGVREMVALLQQPDSGPWRTVRGMVADLLTVQRVYAPLIDLALGERAQRFLVRNPKDLVAALEQRPQPFSGRVGFLPIEPGPAPPAAATPADAAALEAEGIPAVQVVTCESPDLVQLPAQLLGNTRIVRDLATARALAACAPGLRLVTLQGELLEPDGSLTVGTHHAESGILSRKSELREQRRQADILDRCIADSERDLADCRERLSVQDARLEAQQQELDALTDQVADLRSRLSQHRQRREGLHEEVVLSRSEISTLEQEISGLEEAWKRAEEQAEAAEKKIQALEARQKGAERAIRSAEQQRQQQESACTAAKVALAQVETRLAALQSRHGQLEADLRQQRQELAQGEQHLAAAQARLEESARTMLQAETALAQGYLDKEAAEQHRADLARQRTQQRQQRQLLAERTQTIRAEWQALQTQAHERELQASNLRHQRDTLSERLREDYQIDLAELYRVRSAECGGRNEEASQSRDAAQANEEIAELKRKLSRLGSVNLESLQELAELEGRAANLQAQFDDLTAAQKALQEIINTINNDSRRLFAETFHTVRGHFQELFRKLFGGGMADVMLEDETDILESGIEIIARPPGKELRSISLMSGGEKTMTAVALLLAIFRSKPSPFCLLDEVDAALDEANIGRYCAVLRDYCDRSQFIIITHSKKTMSAADVIYGITMQESGISKRVAVRFEDWPEDEPQETEKKAAS